jgi:cytidylate kinase
MTEYLQETDELRVAIDGPAGSGKSTLARELARALGYLYVDTGAMYRAIAYKAIQAGLDPANESDHAAIIDIARQVEFHFQWEDDTLKLFIDGEDVSEAIRTPAVEKLSSPVSALPGVREELVAAQKILSQAHSIVMEGRDIGTVVMPDADAKIFLTANPDERARRRWRQQRERGTSRPLQMVQSETMERDRRDSSRAVSPLKPAEDAIVLDCTDLSRAEVLEEAVRIVEEARARRDASL